MDINLYIDFFFSPNTAMMSTNSHRAGITLRDRERRNLYYTNYTYYC